MNKELALILDFKFLNDSNILLQEFLTLLTIKFPDIGYDIVDEVKNELQNKNFIKIIIIFVRNNKRVKKDRTVNQV